MSEGHFSAVQHGFGGLNRCFIAPLIADTRNQACMLHGSGNFLCDIEAKSDWLLNKKRKLPLNSQYLCLAMGKGRKEQEERIDFGRFDQRLGGGIYACSKAQPSGFGGVIAQICHGCDPCSLQAVPVTPMKLLRRRTAANHADAYCFRGHILSAIILEFLSFSRSEHCQIWIHNSLHPELLSMM